MKASSYFNWGSTIGTNGYGLRDNLGKIEFKNSGDPGWTSLLSGGITAMGNCTSGDCFSVVGGSCSIIAFNNSTWHGALQPHTLSFNRYWYLPNLDGDVALTDTGTKTDNHCAKFSSGLIVDAGATCNSGSMTYPGVGIAQSTGSAWDTPITTGAGLAGAWSDETGTGYAVFSASPSFTTAINLGGSSSPLFTISPVSTASIS